MLARLCFRCVRAAKIHQLADECKHEGRKEYGLLGESVSPKCLSAVLAVGKRRFHRASKGMLDGRFGQFGGGVRQSPKCDTVDKFLLEMHASVAETLPNGCLGKVFGPEFEHIPTHFIVWVKHLDMQHGVCFQVLACSKAEDKSSGC